MHIKILMQIHLVLAALVIPPLLGKSILHTIKNDSKATNQNESFNELQAMDTNNTYLFVSSDDRIKLNLADLFEVNRTDVFHSLDIAKTDLVSTSDNEITIPQSNLTELLKVNGTDILQSIGTNKTRLFTSSGDELNTPQWDLTDSSAVDATSFDTNNTPSLNLTDLFEVTSLPDQSGTRSSSELIADSDAISSSFRNTSSSNLILESNRTNLIESQFLNVYNGSSTAEMVSQIKVQHTTISQSDNEELVGDVSGDDGEISNLDTYIFQPNENDTPSNVESTVDRHIYKSDDDDEINTSPLREYFDEHIVKKEDSIEDSSGEDTLEDIKFVELVDGIRSTYIIRQQTTPINKNPSKWFLNKRKDISCAFVIGRLCVVKSCSPKHCGIVFLPKITELETKHLDESIVDPTSLGHLDTKNDAFSGSEETLPIFSSHYQSVQFNDHTGIPINSDNFNVNPSDIHNISNLGTTYSDNKLSAVYTHSGDIIEDLKEEIDSLDFIHTGGQMDDGKSSGSGDYFSESSDKLFELTGSGEIDSKEYMQELLTMQRNKKVNKIASKTTSGSTIVNKIHARTNTHQRKIENVVRYVTKNMQVTTPINKTPSNWFISKRKEISCAFTLGRFCIVKPCSLIHCGIVILPK